MQQHDGFLEIRSGKLELACSSVFISRILDHNYLLPVLCIYKGDRIKFVHGNVNGQNESVHKWLKRSSPDFVTRIRVMLEVVRIIRYTHSIGTLFSPVIQSTYIGLDSDLRAKISYRGLFAWQVRENLIFYSENFMADFEYESTIAAFAELFQKVCFDDDHEKLPKHLVEDARRLMERCCAEDPKSRPTVENIVQEMELWNIT
ncbi:hypothetical protein M378DRAFT_161980 [Amanita muscaria Koide BX008]|uniref:Protein kinase domain-containing protein n=1 Tax=Amanita muscaria (strain Koide BX008) TaxID=946122 RepID=A0A0C2WUB5_AMAMK|nr:hypothetical protein M378DRAFT_161980 [Amanita muscaria Koide BX008]